MYSKARYFDTRNPRSDDRRDGGPHNEFRRSGYLSHEHRDNHYVVNDRQDRHLSTQPRNHRRVRAGNDYVLAAIATGLIGQILLST
jgi:Ni/Co efflux regulator RcnB